MRRKERKITDQNEIDEIIEHADVCRIALSFNDVPYLVSMNFGYRKGDLPALFFHSATRGKKLDIIRKNNRTCFQMSLGHQLIETRIRCNCGMQYKSVVGFGKISFVTGKADKIEGLNAIVRHYYGRDRPQYKDAYVKATTVLRLDIEELTGKKCEGPAELDPNLPIG